MRNFTRRLTISNNDVSIHGHAMDEEASDFISVQFGPAHIYMSVDEALTLSYKLRRVAQDVRSNRVGPNVANL